MYDTKPPMPAAMTPRDRLIVVGLIVSIDLLAASSAMPDPSITGESDDIVTCGAGGGSFHTGAVPHSPAVIGAEQQARTGSDRTGHQQEGASPRPAGEHQ